MTDLIAMLDKQIESARSLSADAYWQQELPKLELARKELAELFDQLTQHCGLMIDHGHTGPDTMERELVRAFVACGGMAGMPQIGFELIGGRVDG